MLKNETNFSAHKIHGMRLLILMVFLMISSLGKAQSPTDAALCFYNWYLQAIKGPAKAHTAIVKKGSNGETVLDYEPYFHNLDSLGCVSDSFIIYEKLRFQICQDHFKDVPFSEYYENIDNNPFFYEQPCPFFTKYQWVGDIEYWSIGSVEQVSGIDQATVNLTLKAGTKQRVWRVITVRTDEHWRIVKIE